MANEKAVLIITGAWHLPEHYHKLTSGLEARGLRAICPRLPTNNGVVPPNSTIHDDVQFIKDIVAKEAAAGTHLAVMGHSWGGMISNASLAEFAVDRNSDKGGVTDIILFCAFIPSEGDSLAGLFGGELPPWLVPQPDDTVIWVDPIARLYNDVSPEEAKWANELCVPFGHKVQYMPIKCERIAWRDIPLTYITCEDDQAIPAAVQDGMVDKVEQQGIKVRKYRLPASHSPFLSMPEKLVDIVVEVTSGSE
ncbi:G-protein coupled receptor [Purpureocillium lavendulum]|uniref:G-protein coupled receptor n=1 Tax=Purpureocillium lavendulum TaxID=1247861 RepID=A0AB34FQ08_9HYPO|nr:G-protein coupled receptor [Purpureocillium lavendulum]